MVWFSDNFKKDSKYQRNELVNFLNENKIGTRLLFSGNLTKQPFMKNLNFRVHGNQNNTDFVMEKTFWIGLHPSLSEEHLNYSVLKIKISLKINILIMTVADYILKFLISKNIKDVFLMNGGAIAFSIDAFSRNNKIKIYMRCSRTSSSYDGRCLFKSWKRFWSYNGNIWSRSAKLNYRYSLLMV